MLHDAQIEPVEGLAHLDLLRVSLVAVKYSPPCIQLGLPNLLGGLHLLEFGCEEDLCGCAFGHLR